MQPYIVSKRKQVQSDEKVNRLTKFMRELTGANELTMLEQYEDDVCRERLLSDLVNTGVVATLITGFSYDSWVVLNTPPTAPIEILKDCVTFATIQCSMLSAISATFLYKKVSACNGRQAKLFLKKYRFYLMGPHVAFSVGTIMFLFMVILFGYMSTDIVPLRLGYIGMGLGCPLMIGAFYVASSKIKIEDLVSVEEEHVKEEDDVQHE